MKYNFSKVPAIDIDGKPIVKHEIHKLLANGIYVAIQDLDLVTKAIEINKGADVELDKVEIETIKEFVKSDRCSLVSFVKKAIVDYIENQKSKEKQV